MKKALVLALSLTLAGFAAQAQTSSVQPANAKQKVEGPAFSFAESKFDFGKIKQGDIVEHVFKFKNTGTAPLIISNIGVSCGCTTPDWSKEPIAPGKSGTITAKFNSAGKMGMQNKVLTIESNATGGNAMVSLVGEVLDPAAAPAASEAAADVKVKAKDSDVKVKAKGKKS
ncbi:DUF1573 domain-containing protein [Hymenobacter jeollabukensis]|uniref:DUF1573 domain-containing protein n=1 Tax=Hymenobacter jeollabukensis TaxID=2025313 RepID=A0A5R8WJF4_9BACT|nr:DUF1573 domain-containing protein [Hymenobacter jeollabukensis]TLM89070.1 DUF1573 domain-containing protein [Hymenobacter jeollabukensis]